MDDCVEPSGEATWFSSLDANSEYWKVSIAEEDRENTTCTCQLGTYRFWRMPFGLTNTPATFQRTLYIPFSEFNLWTGPTYLDDLSVFSKSFDADLKNVAIVLSTLREGDVSVNLKKCCFFKDSVEYLGHITNPGALTIKDRVESLNPLQHPRNVTKLWSFRRLCNLYQRFFFKLHRYRGATEKVSSKGTTEELTDTERK